MNRKSSGLSLMRFALTLAAMLVGLGVLIAVVWAQSPHSSTTGAAGGRLVRGAAQPTLETAGLKIAENYGKLPLRFEANQGQTASQVKFLSRGNGYSLFLTATESVLTLNGPVLKAGDKEQKAKTAGKHAPARSNQGAVLRMKLLHGNPNPPVKGLEESSGTSNYFIGNDPKQWRTNVRNYGRVKFERVYPGVDLVYYGNQRQLEYDFIVGAGVDPSVIQLGFAGADRVKINSQGELTLQTAAGEVRWHKPVVYQEVDGARQAVKGNYVLKGKEAVGFEVASYDSRFPLVIDPTLAYSTYVGGSSSDTGFAVSTDSSGNAYVTGLTGSADFPTVTPLQSSLASSGSSNVFITKLNALGNGLVYSTYLGGSGGGVLSEGDWGSGIAVDSAGNVYVTGFTFSSDFPTTPGAFQATAPGTGVPFVAKLNAAGNALIYSTYLGGSNLSAAFQSAPVIAIDVTGNAYVAGSTFSSDFPTVNAVQSTYGGSGDCFVTKLNPIGSGLIYSTYLGGSDSDGCGSIAVDSTGNAYVSGTTQSRQFATIKFPFTASVGNGSGFVLKLNNSGNGIIFSTQLGGISGNHGDAGGGAVAVDSANNVYLAGGTNATDFPTTLNAFQTTFGGGNNDAYVMKLDSAGANILFASYLGGSGGDGSSAIALDSLGKIFVAGVTNSLNFPTSADAPQMFFGGGNADAFVAEIDPSSVGSGTLVYASYLGGSGPDHAFSMALDPAGNVYVAGNSGSTDFPTTFGSFQPGFGGGSNDAFVTKISATGSGTPASIQATAGASQSATINAVFGPMTASVADSGGHGVSGTSVTFSAPGSGASGTFAGGGTTTVATTNSSGVATAPAFTANTIAGNYAVTASVSGVATTATFSLTNNPGPPASIAATTGTPQSVLISTGFATVLKATVKDGSGNPVPGTMVTFTAPGSGASGTFSGGGATASVTTDSSGVATAPTFTANSTGGGPYNVTATVAGVGAAASFALTNVDFSVQPAASGAVQITAGTPASVTLNLTTTPAGTPLPADVNYTCAVPSSLIATTCTLSPTKTSAGSTSGNTTLSITTTASVPPLPSPPDPWAPYLLWISATTIAWIMAMFFLVRKKIARSQNRPAYASFALLMVALAGLAGCSSASKSMSTPKGASTITVTSTSGAVSKTTTININVK